MKKTVKCIAWLLLIAMILTIFMPLTTQAVTISDDGVIYDTSDPKGFYKKMEQNKIDALFAGGSIFFATQGKTARNPNGTRYSSIGYTIKVTDGEKSVTIEVKRGGKYMKDLSNGGMMYDDGYSYGLFEIKYNDIKDLCIAKDSSCASMFEKATINIKMDAIMCILKNSVAQGRITAENTNGTITTDGTVYRLVNDSEWKELRKTFTSHDFKSYRNIEKDVKNNRLTIKYYADTASGASSLSTAAQSTKHTIGSDYLLTGASQGLYQFQSGALKTLTTLGLSKPGYHVVSGSEWKDTERGITLSANTVLHADELQPGIVNGNDSLLLAPNWQKNTYTLSYDAGGGVGTMSSDTLTFDGGYYIPKTNAFKKEGYSFNGWKLCKKLKIYNKSSNKIRKTYGTILLDNNTDERLVREQMGHSGINVTEDHYHRNRRSINKKAEILSQIPDFTLTSKVINQ